MEKIQARRKHAALAVCLTGALLFALLFWGCHRLESASISELVRSDLPLLAIKLELVDAAGNAVPPERSPLQSRALQRGAGLPAAAPTEGKTACEEYRGGDKTERSAGEGVFQPECPVEAVWKIIRHPVSLSISARRGEAVLAWLKENPAAKKFFESRVMQGILYEPLRTAGVRAEDLKLEGLKGAVFARIFEEALNADAELHYDVVHGRSGFVFSFVREKTVVTASALPLIARRVARSGYKTAALEEPILEMRVGKQRLFLTQSGGRIYLANGLESLLNVLDNLPLSRAAGGTGSLDVTVRGEAFFKELLPFIAGREQWPVAFSIDLERSSAAPGMMLIGEADFLRHLQPQIARGVLAAVPRDVFAAAAGSFYYPAAMSAEQWNQFLANSVGKPAEMPAPQTAGIAVVWDFSGSEPEKLTQIGAAIARPDPAVSLDDYRRVFSAQTVTGECAGGSVFLAAASDTLFTRMKESCEGQSPSVLDLETADDKAPFERVQLAVLLNAGAGVKELLTAGMPQELHQAPAAEEPEWKKRYHGAAQAIRAQSEKSLSEWPQLAYAGSSSALMQQPEGVQQAAETRVQTAAVGAAPEENRAISLPGFVLRHKR